MGWQELDVDVSKMVVIGLKRVAKIWKVVVSANVLKPMEGKFGGEKGGAPESRRPPVTD